MIKHKKFCVCLFTIAPRVCAYVLSLYILLNSDGMVVFVLTVSNSTNIHINKVNALAVHTQIWKYCTFSKQCKQCEMHCVNYTTVVN